MLGTGKTASKQQPNPTELRNSGCTYVGSRIRLSLCCFRIPSVCKWHGGRFEFMVKSRFLSIDLLENKMSFLVRHLAQSQKLFHSSQWSPFKSPVQQIHTLYWEWQPEENNWVSVFLIRNVWESFVKLFRNFDCLSYFNLYQQWFLLCFRISHMYTFVISQDSYY